jgi:hypothetical protein
VRKVWQGEMSGQAQARDNADHAGAEPGNEAKLCVVR